MKNDKWKISSLVCRRSIMNHQRPFALIIAFLLTAVCLLLSAVAASAQSATATLSGSVQDANGAVVPGTSITITNIATTLKREAATNSDGNFTVPLLPPGTYTLRAERDGFAPVQIENVLLNVGDQKALAIQLKTGDVKAQVQVISEATLINESSAVATTIDRQFVNNLPLNGRSFQSLILLTPGVVVTPAGGQPNSGQFSINGQRNNANYFTVDGVSANIGVGTSNGSIDSKQAAGSVPGLTALGTTSNLVSIDALEEFKIQTATYTAEFGRQPGGQVQLVTRSGGNEFHGTAFEYLRNEAFDANNWFNNRAGLKKPPLRQNQFGGTFSGPVFLPRFGEGDKPYWSGRNRTFFFFSYEGLRLTLPRTFNVLVPSQRLRELTPTALKPLLNIFPVPTGPETTGSGGPSGAAPFVGTGPNRSTIDATSVRIDYILSSKLTLFGRYNDAPSTIVNRSLSSLTRSKTRTRTLTLGSFFSLTPRANN